MAFSDLTGQKNIKMRLAAAIGERQSGTFMFTGPVGSGRHSFAEEFAKETGAYRPLQFDNELNVEAQYKTTAKEIL